MPPFVGRKRVSTSPILAAPPPKKVKPSKTTSEAKASTKPKLGANQAKAKKIERFELETSSDSSLSDVDSDTFEDVPGSSKHVHPSSVNEHDDNEDVEWEDAPVQPAAPDFSNREFKDINITVNKDEEPADYSARPAKKAGPSKREKEARMTTHKLHVQFLLWHNAKRNAWINDNKVHQTLLRSLPSPIRREIDKWKRASGLVRQEMSPTPTQKKAKKWKANGERNERDWGRPSQRLDASQPDMSRGDPIIALLKVLAAFWKKKFYINAPGLRKRGYGSRLGLRKDIESYRNEKHHPAKHGEKITTLNHFRKIAETCEGSRDVGAQLFVALLRAIGIEARMVASLQPAGFGFTKAEQMVPRKIVDPEEPGLSESMQDASGNEIPELSRKSSAKSSPKKHRRTRPNRAKGARDAPIDLDSDADSMVSSANESVEDVTPTMPKARAAKYDRDLTFPVYWAEALSPITSKVFPICPLVLEDAVATSQELLASFEPRGAKADNTRQVFAYVVAYSPDCSAKDVTIRYLRKQIWPGKTKGFRVPIEKMPVYDKRGKVKRYEDYDWFKHSLSFYGRSDEMRTAADDLEDATDLVSAEPEKKQVEGDTLQSLKQSADFVIEKHLRREEALIPDARPVRHFTNGKGDKQEEIPVYKRTDVRRVMTAESWHKEGRAPKEGEVPMKLAPVRAVTLARKREAEAHLIRTGEKQMQGLYSQEQTNWIIPPPIQNGVIPKNAYGNIDCFVPSMVPKGAVHLPLKGTVRICKKLEIDFAEAVVGFEFGNKMAVPVIHGVIIAKEHERAVRDAWRTWNEDQKKKEETKLERLVLEMWRKMTIGLRIRARVSSEYGVAFADASLERGTDKEKPIVLDDDEQIIPGDSPTELHDNEFGGGFLMDHEDEIHRHEDLVMDAPASSPDGKTAGLGMGAETDASQEYPTPMSTLSSTMQQQDGHGKEAVEDEISALSEDKRHHHDSGTIEDEKCGGFLQDDDEYDEKAMKFDHSQSSSKVSATMSLEKKSKIKAEPKSRVTRKIQKATSEPSGRGRSRQAATVSKELVTTRQTPSRNAKSQIKNMSLEQSADSNDSDSKPSANSSAGEDSDDAPPMRRKRMVKQKVATTSKPARVTRAGAETRTLLRTESTIVTSPYFEDVDASCDE